MYTTDRAIDADTLPLYRDFNLRPPRDGRTARQVHSDLFVQEQASMLPVADTSPPGYRNLSPNPTALFTQPLPFDYQNGMHHLLGKPPAFMVSPEFKERQRAHRFLLRVADEGPWFSRNWGTWSAPALTTNLSYINHHGSAHTWVG